MRYNENGCSPSENVDLALGITEVARGNDGDNDVEAKEGKYDAQVPPSSAEGDMQWSEELVSNPVLAVMAGRGGVGLLKVSSESSDEATSPLLTCLARGRIEDGELIRATLHNESLQLRADQARDDASVGTELIHPGPPEPRQIRVRNGNTSEGRQDDSDGGIREHSDLDTGRQSTDGLSQADTKQLYSDDHKQEVPRSGFADGALTKSQRPVREHPVQDGTDNGPRSFSEQLSDGEDVRTVHSARCLTDEDHTVDDKRRYNLVDDNGRQDSNPEDSEDSELKVTEAVAEVQERQGDEQGQEDVNEDPSPGVIGRSP